jgi:hypothetical protein
MPFRLPAIVSLHSPKTVEMPQHTSNHTRDSGNAFEEDESDEPFALVHGEASRRH